MTTVLLIIGIVVVVAASIALVIRITAPIARRKLEELAAAPELAGAELTAQASSFGVASLGKAQNRGLGVLGLTPTHLVFRPVAGKNAVDIPRSAITTVDVQRSFLGKAQNHDLLHVTWTTAEGTDESAWRLPDMAPWLDALR